MIIIVDKDQVNRALLRVCLESNAYHALEAQSGREAYFLFLTFANRIQCIIMDDSRGEGGSFWLADSIYSYCMEHERALLPIMIGMSARHEYIQKFESHERFQSAVEKPVHLGQLLDVIKEAI